MRNCKHSHTQKDLYSDKITTGVLYGKTVFGVSFISNFTHTFKIPGKLVKLLYVISFIKKVIHKLNTNLTISVENNLNSNFEKNNKL